MRSLIVTVSALLVIAGCSSSEDKPQETQYGTPDIVALHAGSGYGPYVAPGWIYEGSLIIVTIPYQNIGDNYRGDDFSCAYSFDGIGMIINPPQDAVTGLYEQMTIMRDEVRYRELRLVVGAAGDYPLVFTFNPEHRIAETDTANNSITIPIHVSRYPSSID